MLRRRSVTLVLLSALLFSCAPMTYVKEVGEDVYHNIKNDEQDCHIIHGMWYVCPKRRGVVIQRRFFGWDII
jgi:hypothetical protein